VDLIRLGRNWARWRSRTSTTPICVGRLPGHNSPASTRLGEEGGKYVHGTGRKRRTSAYPESQARREPPTAQSVPRPIVRADLIDRRGGNSNCDFLASVLKNDLEGVWELKKDDVHYDDGSDDVFWTTVYPFVSTGDWDNDGQVESATYRVYLQFVGSRSNVYVDYEISDPGWPAETTVQPGLYRFSYLSGEYEVVEDHDKIGEGQVTYYDPFARETGTRRYRVEGSTLVLEYSPLYVPPLGNLFTKTDKALSSAIETTADWWWWD
jgi:hypothetical protein